MEEENLVSGTQTGDASTGQSNVDSNVASAQQGAYQPVTEEEAVTLPYEELRARMRREAELVASGELTLDQSGGSGEAPGTDANAESGSGEGATTGNAGNAGDTNEASRQRNGGTQQQGDTPNFSELLREANARNQTLAEEVAQIKRDQQQREFQANHNARMAQINSIPDRAQRDNALNAYRNELERAASGEYLQTVQQRERAVAEREFATVRGALPGMLREVANAVAERHGVDAASLTTFLDSTQATNLITSATNPEALTAVAATIGELLDWQATVAAGRQAAEREERRRAAAANPPVQRSAPTNGVALAGGDQDEATRINNMTRESFLEYIAKKRKEAQRAR